MSILPRPDLGPALAAQDRRHFPEQVRCLALSGFPQTGHCRDGSRDPPSSARAAGGGISKAGMASHYELIQTPSRLPRLDEPIQVAPVEEELP